MTEADIALTHLANRAGQLHSLPAVALQVLELTQQSQVDTRALKECIENDPALAGKVLRVVNSAMFGLSREVSDLNQALTLLGIKPLKLLVLGFSLSENFCAQTSGKLVSRYWRHTLTKAVAARELSESLWRIPGDEAFLVGLLQDLGLLVLLQDVGEPFAQFLEEHWTSYEELAQLEKQAFGFNHRELTSRLLHTWGLPEMLANGVLGDEHQDYTDAAPPQRALPHILQLAELLADLLVERRPSALSKLLASESPHPLSTEQLRGLCSRLQERVESLADVFSLELPRGLDYSDVLVEAHSKLASLAEEVAREMLMPGGSSGRGPQDAEHQLLHQVQHLAVALSAITRPGSAEAAEPEPPRPRVAPARPAPAAPARCAPAEAAVAVAEVDPVLLNWLATAVTACRQARLPLSLALIELDNRQRLEREQGELQMEKLAGQLGDVCRSLDARAMVCLQVRRTAFALVLPGWDRDQAADLSDQLLPRVRQITVEQPDGQLAALSASVGMATVTLPPKNFVPQVLLDSAARCLAAAQRSGGNTLKSIGIY